MLLNNSEKEKKYVYFIIYSTAKVKKNYMSYGNKHDKTLVKQ